MPKWHRLAAIRLYFAAIDMLVLTGLVSWGAAAIAHYGPDYSDAPAETGLPWFNVITTVNVVMGFIYSCAHLIGFPVYVVWVCQ